MKLLLLLHLLLLGLHDQVNFLLDPLKVEFVQVLLLIESSDRWLLLMAVVFPNLCRSLSTLISLATLSALAALKRILILVSCFVPVRHHLFAPQLLFDFLKQ